MEEVGLAEGVLGEASVELDDVLDLVEGGNVERERDLGNEEGQALSARRRGERAGVLEERGRCDVVDDLGEVERAGLGAGSRRHDLVDVLYARSSVWTVKKMDINLPR